MDETTRTDNSGNNENSENSDNSANIPSLDTDSKTLPQPSAADGATDGATDSATGSGTDGATDAVSLSQNVFSDDVNPKHSSMLPLMLLLNGEQVAFDIPGE